MRERIRDARRIVVKLGSNLFFNDAGVIALGRIFSFIEDIAAARLAGRQMIVVSSGAVALGADALKMKSATASLAQKQALAAIGQSRLMNLYEQGFSKYGLTAAQILLTEEDFSSRKRYLNLRHTLGTLLDMGVIPIINENDTVSTTELEVTDRSPSFGDNDKLSALVMSKLDANAFASSVAGRIHINEGALDAITRKNASLLYAGVTRIENKFDPGDVVAIIG